MSYLKKKDSNIVSRHYDNFGSTFEADIIKSKNPSVWATTNQIQKEITKRVEKQRDLFERFFVNKNARVLDVGCGFGRQSFILTEMGYKVTGIDVSKKLIDIAEKVAKGKYDSRINFGYMSATDMAFKSNSFDYIVCLDVLEHTLHRKEILFECNRLLKEGGLSIITFPSTKKRKKAIKNLYNRFHLFYNYLFKDLTKIEHPFPIPSLSEIIDILSSLKFSIEYLEGDETIFIVARKVIDD